MHRSRTNNEGSISTSFIPSIDHDTDFEENVWELAKELKFELLCGVHYTALTFVTVISIQHGIPLHARWKEAKDYGTKCVIGGVFKPGQQVLVM